MMERKSIAMMLIVGLMAVAVIFSLLMLSIAGNRYRKVKGYVNFISDSSLVIAGFSRAQYKIKNDDFEGEKFDFSGQTIQITITQDDSDSSKSSVVITPESGTVELTANFEDERLVGYKTYKKKASSLEEFLEDIF